MTETAVESLVRQLADGRFHSGESLAALLGVSRTAVWKRMQKISHDTGLFSNLISIDNIELHILCNQFFLYLAGQMIPHLIFAVSAID